MTVYLVMYSGLGEISVEGVFSTEEKAEDYVLKHGGWHSEIHSYSIDEMEIDE